jgi:hypothetical protein
MSTSTSLAFIVPFSVWRDLGSSVRTVGPDRVEAAAGQRRNAKCTAASALSDVHSEWGLNLFIVPPNTDMMERS